VGHAPGGGCSMARWASISKSELVGPGRDAIDVDTDGRRNGRPSSWRLASDSELLYIAVRRHDAYSLRVTSVCYSRPHKDSLTLMSMSISATCFLTFCDAITTSTNPLTFHFFEFFPSETCPQYLFDFLPTADLLLAFPNDKFRSLIFIF